MGTLSITAMSTNCANIGIHTIEAVEGHMWKFWPRSVSSQMMDQTMTTSSLTTIHQTVAAPLNASLSSATQSVTDC